MKQKQSSGKKIYLIAFLIIWVVQMAAAFYFCTQKQGFHEDEYYTYYSTARTNGFYVESGQWMDREVYRNEFVVLPEERFQYGLVKLVQSWDVHPPMYYWVFHTVASFVPNVFSKWIGLSVNLFFHGINIILMTYLSYLIAGHDGKLSLCATLLWGLSSAVVSGVVFIRMYEMLTMFVLLCAILHVREVPKRGTKISVLRTLVPMAVVTYLGFLTQYYYFIFLFYLGIAFSVWLIWRDRNLWNCIRYGVGQGVAFVLAYLTYPSCLGQMFRGQRGAQATENFFDLSNTLGRMRFFYDLMDRFAFGHLLSILLLFILVFAVAAYRWGRIVVKDARGQSDKVALELHGSGFGAGFWMLVFTAAGYFVTVSKTALLLGDTSNRYQLPIYGIVVLLVFVAVCGLWRVLSAGCAANSKYVKYVKYAETIFVVLWLVAVLLGHCKDGVVFLYPEDEEQVAFAEECAAQGTLAVYLYQPGEEWCIWDVADELFMYPKVYFAAADGSSVDRLNDIEIQNADSLVVYIASGADNTEQTMRVSASADSVSGCTRIFEEKYCDVWYFE
ncbi:MAG: hypothetical protein J1F18_02085 [Lachnospiraceae bacterium]|nr:hypothetical protein [Lachnospiraceae bacterium]